MDSKIIQISSVQFQDGWGVFNALREDGSVISVTFSNRHCHVVENPVTIGQHDMLEIKDN